jgi:cell fate regulator YaaT (PSP1 superfamily)
MQTVVGVRFKKAGKIYYFQPGDLKIAVGDHCIVETSRGIEFGEVVVAPKQVPDNEVVQPLKQVIRIATDEDKEHTARLARRAKEAFEIALKKIAEHGLPMKLVDAEYTFDDSKLLFYFTADGRVDFRELVKDLAAIFRIRIELRQIGVRDEAKMIGGLGSCGRPLCCATFLGDFAPVSIKMAKEQNLSLNPSKISGICGRLMCCLRYEADVYKTHKSLYGDGCPGCQTLALADEFFNEVEDEEEFYSDLLKEDTIQAVDYEIMREAAEVEERPLISRDPSDEAAAPEGEKADSETSHEQPKPARKGSSKRKKSAKRRKAPEGEKPQQPQKASAAEQEQEKPKPKPKLRRPRRKRRKPSGERSEAPQS